MHNKKNKCLIAIVFSAIFAGSIPFAATHNYKPVESVKAVEETSVTETTETEESFVTTEISTTTDETEKYTTTEFETTTEETILIEPETEVVFAEEIEVEIEKSVVIETDETEPSVVSATSITSEIVTNTETEATTETETVETVNSYSYSATDDEIMLIARVAEAEAGYVEEGRRYVIDTILNRVDSDIFPNTIAEVIYQKNQFAVVTTGAIWNVSITEDRLDLVKEELTSRTNYEVGFFRAGYYGPYGDPLFECGGNYFSTIK